MDKNGTRYIPHKCHELHIHGLHNLKETIKIMSLLAGRKIVIPWFHTHLADVSTL